MLYYLVFMWFAVAFAKIVLCLPHITRVAYVLGRKHDFVRRGQIPLLAVIAVGTMVLLIVPLAWPVALWHEGWRFFTMYRAREVIRSCLTT